MTNINNLDPLSRLLQLISIQLQPVLTRLLLIMITLSYRPTVASGPHTHKGTTASLDQG